MHNDQLADFLAEVVLTSHYLAEPMSSLEADMTDAEVRCLRVIEAFQPIAMQDIASKLRATKSRATQLVALLESRGLIERRVAADRRRIEVSPSKSGQAAILKLNKRYAQLADAIQKKLGPDDTEQLRRLLGAILPLSQLENKDSAS